MDIGEYLADRDQTPRISHVSFLSLKPGDLIHFNYEDGTERTGLVVRSKRTSSGYFLSSRNNTLLNVFLVDALTSDMFDLMINNLYRNRIRSTYKNTPRILGAFLGQSNFRTFNVSRINRILSILL